MKCLGGPGTPNIATNNEQIFCWVKNRSKNKLKNTKKTLPAKRGAIAPVRTSELLASNFFFGVGGLGPNFYFLGARPPPKLIVYQFH